eukprot:3515924-Amphidinium_carterae.3
MLRSFRTPDHPLWGTCLTVSLVRAGFQKLYVRSTMETMYTNPVSGCRAHLEDTSLRYEPAIIVSLAQFQQQDRSINITSAVAVPEELLLEFDWWIRNEWRVDEPRQMYEHLALHAEAVVFMRASALMPTKRPEVINLRKTAKNAKTGPDMLTGTYEKMPGLLRGMAKWNYIIREEAMQKFRTYFRHSHPIAVFVTKPSQDIYYCPASFKTEVSFASHEYRVAFLTYKGLYRNQNGNWQWNSDDNKYGAEVEQLGFYFYWYGLVKIDDQKTISGPDFLKAAADTRRIRQIPTAPYPLSALKNDVAKQRNEQEAVEFTRGTMNDIVEKRARQLKKQEEKKKLMEEPLAYVPGLLPSDSASASAAASQPAEEAARRTYVDSREQNVQPVKAMRTKEDRTHKTEQRKDPSGQEQMPSMCSWNTDQPTHVRASGRCA